MSADRDRLIDLTVHLKRASDALLGAARHLAVLSHEDQDADERCAGALDELIAVAIEMAAMERVLRELVDAHRGETPAPGTRRLPA
jgi:hypothetical protein